ncbi:hypothetical protein F1880_001952 [Penicillium rolfsii]|nr:hypothetical protein F1880_001952 [Penicillium rolfsii]
MSRSMRSSNHHELSPVAEMESKLRNPQRRRVPVACGRCRRRKIKCSGDSGDGQGCSNCRSAGNTDCHFLRVNSNTLKLTTTANSWPYPNPGAAAVPSPRLGTYTTTAAAKPTLLSVGSSPARMPAFQRPSDYLSTADGAVFSERAAMTVESMQYEDGQPTNYSQSPAYMHPNTPAGTLFDYGGSPWSPKIWESGLGVSRPSNGSIYPDPEANNSIAQSPFSYMLPSQNLSSSEGPQSTTVATAGISSADLPGPDRTLPTPTCRSQPLPSTLAGLVFAPTEPAASSSVPMESRSGFWSPCFGPSHDSRSPPHTISGTVLFSNSPPPTTRCPTTGTNSDLLFSSLSMPITTEEMISSTLSPTTAPSTTTASTTSYSIQPLDATIDTRPTIPVKNRTHVPASTSTDRSRSRGVYHERTTAGQRLVALTADCTPDIYNYASSEKSKRAGDGRSGTLMNGGLEYHPVRHTHTPNPAFSFGLLHDGLPELHRTVVEGVHRAPVSPLGNQGGY